MLFAAATLTAGTALVALHLRSFLIDVLAILTVLIAGMTLVGTVMWRLVNTEIGSRIALSIGVGVGGPGAGALIYGTAGTPTWLSLSTNIVNRDLFQAIAIIASQLTLALVISMRFAGSLPPGLERERRMVFRWFSISGFLTTMCAGVGICLVSSTGAHQGARMVSRGIATIFGASVFGTFVTGALVLFLSAVPCKNFNDKAASEDLVLDAEGAHPRRRLVPARCYAWRAAATTVFAIGLLAGAIVEWWIAVPALLVSGTWLVCAWSSRAQAARADENVPFHPVTFMATIVAGISLTFIAHAVLSFLEPGQTQTAAAFFGLAGAVLSAGYVAFASGHPPEPQSGFLPSLDAVGVWCGVSGLAGVGLVGSVLGLEHAGGWFPFWVTVTSTPALLIQIVLMRSSSIRP